MRKLIYIFPLLLFILFVITNCKDKKAPFDYDTHPEGWVDEDSENFHGNMVLEGVLGVEGCSECHGADFLGGNSGVGCWSSSCHSIFPHPTGWADSLSDNFHANAIVSRFKWQIEKCQQCHGKDYTGMGYAVKNCTRCHTEPKGPEACNTCHGSDKNPAPPKDLEGNTARSFVGVGAHQVHLTDSTFTTAFDRDCIQCHIKPQNYEDEGHIDGQLPAEITFSLFASDSGKTQPLWNHDNATCSNVYCHGDFKFKKSESKFSWIYTDSVITGNNPVITWNDTGEEQVECGTCHDLPPKGHLAQTTCNTCHGKVVDADNNIIDKKLHINGQIDVF
ncbi:MAG: hypothetical protein GXO77_02905 [Calditrichaeota bacterium]|nr:hypothetical protein [Calditrichota bacterium]